jgi:hypothetical protein
MDFEIFLIDMAGFHPDVRFLNKRSSAFFAARHVAKAFNPSSGQSNEINRRSQHLSRHGSKEETPSHASERHPLQKYITMPTNSFTHW